MLEFLLALFGGTYYAGKYLTEKSKDQQSNLLIEQKQRIQEEYLSKYAASYDLSQQVKKDIISGKYYDDIIKKFAKDFQFVFGEDWMNQLNIPTATCPDKIRRQYERCFSIGAYPTSHMEWVYHLMLAKHGKMDEWAMRTGYGIGILARENTNMCVRFTQCIERIMRESGADIHLVLELENITPNHKRTICELTGGHVKVDCFCNYDTACLW
jgi:hypothetical protein